MVDALAESIRKRLRVSVRDGSYGPTGHRPANVFQKSSSEEENRMTFRDREKKRLEPLKSQLFSEGRVRVRDVQGQAPVVLPA